MDLSGLSTSELERLQAALAGGRVAYPLSRFSLQNEGIEGLQEEMAALNAVGREGALAVIGAVLSERRACATAPELVWTGPESRRSAARDTAVVLASLFKRAQSSVLLAGFVFDHGAEVLRPLHEAMKRGVSCRLFADADATEAFVRSNWPFGPPFPEVHRFRPPAGVFASLHAKCVVVDGRWVFITSANFTDRGQTRNVEVGVVLEDVKLAAVLEAQFVAGEWFEPVRMP